MIEDTSFVIDLLRGAKSAIDTLEWLEANRVPEKLSSVTVMELQEGIIRSGHPDEKKQRIQSVLTSKHIIAADQEVIMKAGTISGQLYQDGTPIDREDCMIGATAILEDEPVLTNNVDHFRRIPDLDVETY